MLNMSKERKNLIGVAAFLVVLVSFSFQIGQISAELQNSEIAKYYRQDKISV